MAVWQDKFINVNGFARSGKKLTDVRKIVIHYTANNGATALNHYNYFKNLDGRYASAHFFIDKLESLCIIPLNEIAYHANDVQKRNEDGSAWRGVKELLPNANYLSIGIEMCVEKDGTFHADTIKRTEDVSVELCKRYGLDPLCDIVMHNNVTAKNCPAPWVKDTNKFSDFKNRVNLKLHPVVPTAPMWNGSVLRENQIGLLEILKPIKLWKRDENNELTTVRVLNVGEFYRVYGYDNLYGGQYNVGGTWITKMDGYVKYTTPSKDLLEQAQEFYKNN